MTKEVHSTNVELIEPAPAELAVGSYFALRVQVTCPSGCDLSGMPVAVTGPDGLAVAIEPGPDLDPAREDGTLVDIRLKAPLRVGEHVWNIRLPAHEVEGALHQECTLPVSIRTIPHGTSLAVWAVPSPVVMGARFRVKVGAKSSGGCVLGGKKILISDQSGAVIAQGNLQETPWPGTSALYWTDVEVPAPGQEGMFWCAVNFAAADVEIAHESAESKFSVAIVRPPQHRLTIEVVEKDTRVPIEDAQVRLGAYAAATDPLGRAEVAVPKGTFDLTVWKVGYEAPSRIVDIEADASIRVEVVIVPPENPDAPWLM